MNRQNILTSRNIFIFGLIVLAASLPSSPYFTSIGQWLMALGWLMERPWEKTKKAFRDKALMVFLLLIVLHVISLLWSKNLSYGLHDIKIKLPLFIIPFLMATSAPITKKEFRPIAYVFVLSVLVVGIYGLFRFYYQGDGLSPDYRKISPFISHIRFSMMQNMAIAMLIYLLLTENSIFSRWGWLHTLFIILLVGLLVVMKTLSGVILLLIVLAYIAYIKIISSGNVLIRWAIIVVLVSSGFFVVNYLVRSYARYNYKVNYDYSQLPEFTPNGNAYIHDTTNLSYENGHAVTLYVCEKELRQEWTKRSNIPYDSVGFPSKYTLIRYLSSKGLTKDSAGIAALSEADILAIEKGVPTIVAMEKYSFYPRLYELFREFDDYFVTGDPNNKSVVQRLYYLKAGWAIFKENLWFGVGVGDVQDSFNLYYEEINSRLVPEKRFRAHNQYLTFMLTFGVLGFVLVLFSQVYPVVVTYAGKKLPLLLKVFFLITLLSMLSEDTLETQAGATYYALFYSLFLWGYVTDEKNEYSEPETKNIRYE